MPSVTSMTTCEDLARRMAWQNVVRKEYETYLWWSVKARADARRARLHGFRYLMVYKLIEARFWRRLAMGQFDANDALLVIGERKEKGKEVANG